MFDKRKSCCEEVYLTEIGQLRCKVKQMQEEKEQLEIENIKLKNKIKTMEETKEYSLY